MQPTQFQTLERFVDVKKKLRLLEAEEALLNPIAVKILQEAGAQTVAGANISLGKKDNYKFTETTERLNTELKALRTYEKSTGKAVVESTTFFPKVTVLD